MIATYQAYLTAKTLKAGRLPRTQSIKYRVSDLIPATESESLGIGLGVSMFGKFLREKMLRIYLNDYQSAIFQLGW